MFVQPYLKQLLFWFVSYDFFRTPTLMFLTPPSLSQKGGLKPRKGLEIWLPHRNFDPLDLPKGPIPKGRPKGKPFRVLGDERRPGRAGHSVVNDDRLIALSGFHALWCRAVLCWFSDLSG